MRPAASSEPTTAKSSSRSTRSGAKATAAKSLPPMDAAPVRAQRQRKAKTVYSPTAADLKAKTALRADGTPKKRVGRPRKVPIATPGASSAEDDTVENTPVYATLAAKIRAQVTKLRYHLAFVEAYEAEGWRRASREKIKPSKELEAANAQILARKRVVVETLQLLRDEYKHESPLAFLVTSGQGDIPSDQIICSRCNSTDTVEDNDILLCDNLGCQRAYHQQCQNPIVRTEAIPQGDELWYCQICLATFNSLKIINSAFGTMYETIEEVFPELKEAPEHKPTGQEGDAEVEEDDEEDDGDFVEGEEDEEPDDVDDDGEESDTAHSSSGDESAISDGELAYLKKDSVVIDSNTRSVRSRASKANAKPDVVGRTVAMIDSSTQELVQEPEESPQSLILAGKRKRTPVDYRQLNDMLYAGEQDSDLDETYEEGADANAEKDNEEDEDSDDYQEGDDSPLPLPPTPTAKSPKRKGRRVQKKKDV